MIRPRQTQELRQEQTLSQRQIQALELLAAPISELQPLVRAELEKNPLLEMEEDPEESILPEEAVPEPVDTGDDSSWVEVLLRMDDEGSPFEGGFVGATPEEDERRNRFLESITAPRTLQDDLTEQVRFLDLDPDLRAACETVVAAVDDRGYCAAHPADLAMATGRPLSAMEEALRIVQTLEPPGIAARDSRERLLLQMDRQGDTDSFAYRVIRDHFDDVAENRLPSLARALRVRLSELQEAFDVLRRLDPVLDLESFRPEPEYVEAEVMVTEREGRLEVQVDGGDLPRLRINQQYKRLLQDPATSPETKEYVREKIRSAASLIQNLCQRQRTLDRIAEALVDLQRDYFLLGSDHLRPMTMATVARITGVHETTVSRAVAGKYLRCGNGLVLLRKLFTGGYQDEGGRLVSSTVVKTCIRDLIAAEDCSRPLSDSQIVESLQERGFHVARRTVAKYRESLHIPPRGRRRRYLS